MDMTQIEKKQIKREAETAFEQILAGVGYSVYGSWGVSNKAYKVYNGMATLALKVNGLIHKGWVYASHNAGKDLYEIRLLNEDRTEVEATIEDVFGDMMGAIIDERIERGDMSEADYINRIRETLCV